MEKFDGKRMHIRHLPFATRTSLGTIQSRWQEQCTYLVVFLHNVSDVVLLVIAKESRYNSDGTRSIKDVNDGMLFGGIVRSNLYGGMHFTRGGSTNQ